MLRSQLARALEQGRLSAPAWRATARLWESIADPVRPVVLPAGAHVIGVGGATLGGAGKTPVVLALARLLSPRVAVVASAYRARVRGPRRVCADDPVTLVGDEALWLARELPDVPVIVGRDRSAALSLAGRWASRVLVDGLLQARPRRLGLSLLVLDGAEPWGAGHCPPAGDLRAARQRMLSAADAVLTSGAVEASVPVLRFRTRLELRAGSFDSLRGLRLGVVLAIARPERVLRSLSEIGITPAVVEVHPDHAPIPDGRAAVDAWLTTPKCATKLGRQRGGAPVWVLEQRVELPPALVALASPHGS